MSSFFLSIYLRVELLDRMVTECITFQVTATGFTKVSAPFFISISQCFHFSVSLLTLIIIWRFDFSYAAGYFGV